MGTTARVRGGRWAVGLVALPLVVAGCGTQHATSSGAGTGDLPLLHVGTRSGAPAAMDAASSGGAGADSGYPLVGTLPTGTSSAMNSVAAWRLTVATFVPAGHPE